MRNELIVEKQKLLDEGFSFLVQAQLFTSTKHLQALLERLTQILRSQNHRMARVGRDL